MERSSFFNSINHDRLYDAENFAKYFSSFISNGVFPNPSTNLQVFSNNDMTVTIDGGMAWVNGYFYENTDNLIKDIEHADGLLNRIDRLVVQVNFITRDIKIKVKKGEFATTPIAPVLQRDADIFEIALADIYIKNGAVTILQEDITDLRLNKNLCGIVHGTVEQVNTTTLFNQYQDWFINWTNQEKQEFEQWFQTIKDKLSGDVAGNLQNGIDINKQKIQSNTDTISEHTTQINNVKTDISNKVDSSIFNTQMADIANVIVATGTGTAITLTMPSVTAYTANLKLTFIASADNSGGATTIDINSIGAKDLYKPNTTTAPNLKGGKSYTVWYNGTHFFLQASAEGNALAEHVLAGKTFSNDDDTGITGTMDLSDLIPNNIRQGVNINGIIGSLIEGKKSAYGVFYPTTQQYYKITCGFKPEFIVFNFPNGMQNYSTLWERYVGFKDISAFGTNQNAHAKCTSNNYGEGGGVTVQNITADSFEVFIISYEIPNTAHPLYWYAFGE